MVTSPRISALLPARGRAGVPPVVFGEARRLIQIPGRQEGREACDRRHRTLRLEVGIVMLRKCPGKPRDEGGSEAGIRAGRQRVSQDRSHLYPCPEPVSW